MAAVHERQDWRAKRTVRRRDHESAAHGDAGRRLVSIGSPGWAVGRLLGWRAWRDHTKAVKLHPSELMNHSLHVTICCRSAESLEVKMTPVCTIAPTAAADPGGVEIGQYAPDQYGVEVG